MKTKFYETKCCFLNIYKGKTFSYFVLFTLQLVIMSTCVHRCISPRPSLSTHVCIDALSIIHAQVHTCAYMHQLSSILGCTRVHRCISPRPSPGAHVCIDAQIIQSLFYHVLEKWPQISSLTRRTQAVLTQNRTLVIICISFLRIILSPISSQGMLMQIWLACSLQ